MTLIINDGTGNENADSFATVAELDTFFVAYFANAAIGPVAAKEAALRRAYVYMRALDWRPECHAPFFLSFSGDGIPALVKNAQCALARIEMDTPNALQPSVTTGQKSVLNRVGEIGWQVIGATGADSERQTVLMANDFLKDYLVQTGGAYFLMRG